MSLTLGLVSIGASLLGQGFSMYQASKQQKEMEGRIKQREKDLTSMFEQEYYQDVLETPYAKSALNKLNEAVEEGEKRDANTAAIMGSSDEAVTANKGERFKGVTSAVKDLAMYGDQRRRSLKEQYMRDKAGIDSQKNAINQGKIQSYHNLTNNLWNATGSLINLVDGKKVGTDGNQQPPSYNPAEQFDYTDTQNPFDVNPKNPIA